MRNKAALIAVLLLTAGALLGGYFLAVKPATAIRTTSYLPPRAPGPEAITGAMFDYFRSAYGPDMCADNYGGCYWDGTNIVILVTDAASVEDILRDYGIAEALGDIKYALPLVEHVTYSINYLNTVKTSVQELLWQNGIKDFGSGINEMGNEVDFFMTKRDYAHALALVAADEELKNAPVEIINSGSETMEIALH